MTVTAHRHPSLFAGIPEGDLHDALAALSRRRFDAGTLLVAPGAPPTEIYIVLSGTAEVVVVDRHGAEHVVGRIEPGTTVGEVGLLTGEPGFATVRALTDVEALVMRDDEFELLAARFPLLYRNVGALLAERLERSDRRAALGETPPLALLRNEGAPPELPWLVACSVAWHTQSPTLLLTVGREPPPELVAVAGDAAGPRPAAATLATALPEQLEARLDELLETYDYVLVLTQDGGGAKVPCAREVWLTDARSTRCVRARETVVRAWAPRPAVVGPDEDGVIRIAPLVDEDVDDLRRGSLPARSAAGKGVGWLARDLAELKVGLALGAGSLRGYAHAGVFKAFARAGLEPDYLAGTSIGGAAAVLKAMGHDWAGVADILDRVGPTLFRPTLSRSSLMSNRALKRFLREVAGRRRLEELPVPVGLVSADLPSQTEVVLRRGPIWLATLATISIPGVYPALRIGGYTLVDGGILNPVPSLVAAEMGADVVASVRLTADSMLMEGPLELREPDGRAPSALAVLLHAFEIMQARIVPDPPRVATLTIMPTLDGLPGAKLRHFAEGRRFIEAGEAAAEAALPRLAALLPWLRAGA